MFSELFFIGVGDVNKYCFLCKCVFMYFFYIIGVNGNIYYMVSIIYKIFRCLIIEWYLNYYLGVCV